MKLRLSNCICQKSDKVVIINLLVLCQGRRTKSAFTTIKLYFYNLLFLMKLTDSD